MRVRVRVLFVSGAVRCQGGEFGRVGWVVR